MVYGLPTDGEPNWGAKVNASIEAVKTTADAAETEITGRLSEANLTASFAPLVDFHFPHANYATLTDLFAYVNTLDAPVRVTVAPGTYTSGPIRIDKSDRRIQAWGAEITLEPSTVSNVHIAVGPDAYRLKMHGGAWKGARDSQTGATSDGLVFEEYTDPAFRFSDRSSLVEVTFDNYKTDNIRVESRRLHIKFNDCFSRDAGRRCLAIHGTDCGWNNGGLGVGAEVVYLDGGANWITHSGIWSATDCGVRMTLNAYNTKLIGNAIDHNATGIKIVGDAGTVLDATILGNEFRGNSHPNMGVVSGTLPDIYLEQVAAINIVGNTTATLSGESVNTSYAIEVGAGVSSITEAGNRFRRSYHSSGKVTNNRAVFLNRTIVTNWLADAPTDQVASSRIGAGTSDMFGVRGDGALTWGAGDGSATDVNLYRSGADTLRTDDNLHVALAATIRNIILNGSGGAGYVLFPEQSASPGPVADAAKMFTKDNGAGKTQVCVQFGSGAPVVIATEP